MVDFIQLPQEQNFGGQLGQALGQGLTSGLQYGMQNRLHQQQEIASELRKNSLQQALLSHEYGLKGQNELAKQQAELEVEKNKSLNKQRIAKQQAEKYGIDYVEGEESSDVHQRARTSKPPAAKGPVGGLSAIPISEDEQNVIDDVLANNPNSTPNELLAAFGRAKVKPAHASPYIENARREREAAVDPYMAAAATSQAKANIEKSTSLLDKGKAADNSLIAIQGMRKNIGSSGFQLRNVLADASGVKAWRDPGSEEFKTYSKQELKNLPQDVGGKVSNFEFQTLADMQAQVDKSQAANEGILDFQELKANSDKIISDGVKRILNNNNGVPPRNFDQLLTDETNDQLQAEVNRWRLKKNILVPQIYKREKVSPGTKLSTQKAFQYLSLAESENPNKNNEEIDKIAEKMAKEDNYEW